MNKKLNVHIQTYWMQYVAVFIAVMVLWIAVFDAMAQPKRHEQVAITFFGDKMDMAGINDKLYSSKNDFTEQPLKNVYMNMRLYDDSMLNQLILAELEVSDIIIFTEDMLIKDKDGQAKVAPATLFRFLGEEGEPELLKKVVGDKADELEYFYDTDINGKSRPIGIYLTSSDGEKNTFEGYYTGDYRCVAFFCHSSVNLGGMFSGEESAQRAALDTLLFLLGGQ